MMKKAKVNAAILIIGNEILSGRTQDTNTSTLATWLNSIGVKVQEVRVIPDIEKTIVDTLNVLRKENDYVFTTGGIGPTHDDITSESISLAVKKKYKLHKGAYEELKKYYRKIKSALTDARMKMAYMPEGSKLILNKVSGAPGFKIENIYVFAGIPSIVQAMMKEFKKMIKIKNKFYSTTISTKLFESKIAHILVQAERKYKNISIGSYPIFDGKPKGVEIVINSQVKKLGVSNAKKFILREINKII